MDGMSGASSALVCTAPTSTSPVLPSRLELDSLVSLAAPISYQIYGSLGLPSDGV